ncbi:hypothetical protein ANCCAN_19857 [Ancylostoma caninum]|uniref:Uncharacterized protein n=1 Tax=Ancylostoma caninum TaxID=29170 RepID=A0A368FQ81_ANCCA|nr:hypothetical protein ANCCAN_19857 [Ancylostoma caninum]
MLLIWAAAIGLVAANGYDTQAGGYETAEKNQPKPYPPVSAGNGDQQAYNSDGGGKANAQPITQGNKGGSGGGNGGGNGGGKGGERPNDAPKGNGKPAGGNGKPSGGNGKPSDCLQGNSCGQGGENDQPAPGGGGYRRRFHASRRF